MLRVCAWLCTEVTCLVGKACTKGGLSGGPASHALWVKLAKMLDVPGVAHWDNIFGLQADCAGPGDSYYPIRAEGVLD